MDNTTPAQDRAIQVREQDDDDSDSGIYDEGVSIAREGLIVDLGHTNIVTAVVIDGAFRSYASRVLAAVQAKSKASVESVSQGVAIDTSVEKHARCVGCAMCQCGDEKVEVHTPNNGKKVRPIHHEGLKFGFCQDPPCPTCWILLWGTKQMLGLETISKKESHVALFPRNGRVEEVRVADDLGSLCSGASSLRLQFYTDEEHPGFCEGFGVSKHVEPDPITDTVIHNIKVVVEECIHSHESCRMSDAAALPTRVLDLTNYKSPVLYVSNGEKEPSNALSHCWGPSVGLTTTLETLQSRKQGIIWTELPKTFQDAIIVTHKLGIRYLWIDSLCIIQDSPDDWALEASRMADIYENSYLTIAATSSTGSEQGFLKFRPEPCPIESFGNRSSCEVFVRPYIDHRAFADTTRLSDRMMLQSAYPLLFRRWAMQERLLCRRMLHWTSSEWVFECNTLTTCECGFFRGREPLEPWQVQREYNRRGAFKAQRSNLFANSDVVDFDAWERIVDDYSSGGISFYSDVLTALSGLASRFHNKHTGRYLAGLWENDMPRGLLWWCNRAVEIDYAQVDGYVAPSWSWASVNGPLQWCRKEGTCVTSLVRGVCVPSGVDSFGAISSGSITLYGPVVEARFEYRGREPAVRNTDKRKLYSLIPNSHQLLRSSHTKSTLQSLTTESHRISISFDTRSMHKNLSGSVVFCLQVTSNKLNCQYLVLVPCETEPKTYRRVGIMSTEGEWSDGVDYSEITIF